MKRQVQFRLSALLAFAGLLPMSVGVWETIGQVSVILTAPFSESIERFADTIELKLGGLSIVNRVLFITAIPQDVIGAMIVGIGLLLLVYARLPRIVEFTLSLAFALPFWMIVTIRPSTLPLTRGFAAYLFKATAVSTLIAWIIMAFFWYLPYRVDLQAIGSSCGYPNALRRCTLFSILAIYVAASAYGWFEIRNTQLEELKNLARWAEMPSDF